jgi:hypothetical protein
MRFNGVSTSIYDGHWLTGNGSSVSSGSILNEPYMYLQRATNSTSTANSFAAFVIDYLDAYSTTKNKTTSISRKPPYNHFSNHHLKASFLVALLLSAQLLLRVERFSLYGIR